MKLIPWHSPFFDVKWLVCESIQSDGEYKLQFALVEHHAVDPAKPSRTSSYPTTLQELEDSGWPIVETDDSRRWTVTFDAAIAFRSESEPYYLRDHWANRDQRGRCFILEQSPWILEIGELLDHLEPGCRHYALITEHGIIEVLSRHEPTVS
jgi:hypothetical protein